MSNRPDIDYLCYKQNKGEFSYTSEKAFSRHIIRLQRAVKVAKKHFPCAKARDFINYVFMEESCWYNTSNPYNLLGTPENRRQE